MCTTLGVYSMLTLAQLLTKAQKEKLKKEKEKVCHSGVPILILSGKEEGFGNEQESRRSPS